MTGHLSILRPLRHQDQPIRDDAALKSLIAKGELRYLVTYETASATFTEAMTDQARALNHVYVDHESGQCLVCHDPNSPDAFDTYDLFDLFGYDRIRDAFATGLGPAPIQIRSTLPYVVGGMLFQQMPLSPNQIVERILKGTPFLLERRQVIGCLIRCLRHAGDINSRCDDGSLPVDTNLRLQDLIVLRLAAERATDRGQMLGRLDNAILSALFTLGTSPRAPLRDQASAFAISEWLGERIAEQHTQDAISGALGTLIWRGFVKHHNLGEDSLYQITDLGVSALQQEIRVLNNLHRSIPRD